MVKIKYTFALVLFCLFSSTHSVDPICAPFCDFRFCINDVGSPRVQAPYINLRESGVGTLPYICNEDPSADQIRSISQVKEAMVADGSTDNADRSDFQAISNYNPPGLPKPFPKKAFTLTRIFWPSVPQTWFGVSKQKMGKKIYKFSNNLCVYIPVKKYSVLDSNGNERLIKVKGNRSANACVAFRTVAPKMLIDLTWNSSSDLELSLTEPNGNTIDRLNPISAATGGKLIRTFNSNPCSQYSTGQEQIAYPPKRTLLGPQYKLEIRHRRNCGIGTTVYALNILINGKKAQPTRVINNNDDNGALIERIFFNI